MKAFFLKATVLAKMQYDYRYFNFFQLKKYLMQGLLGMGVTDLTSIFWSSLLGAEPRD